MTLDCYSTTTKNRSPNRQVTDNIDQMLGRETHQEDRRHEAKALKAGWLGRLTEKEVVRFRWKVQIQMRGPNLFRVEPEGQFQG